MRGSALNVGLVTFHFSEAMQRYFILKSFTGSLEFDQLPIELKPY